MYFSIHNRRLLSGMVAGAVALASASACSRSDRANAGRDSTQTGAAAPDSQASPSASASARPNTATQPTTGSQPSSADSATATPSTRRPRSSPARASTANGDQGVAGYKAMGQDAAPQPSDTSAVASVTDTAVKADSTATEMARDSSMVVAQGDTAAQALSQVQADTATIGDTAVILTRADTSKTEMAMGHESDTMAADTVAVANDSAAAERIHPDTVSQKAAELAKHEPARVRPPADSTADAAAVAAAGIASTGNIATGADAVALMSRQGKRCVVAASDENRDVLWDMASSPSSLNPCGTGTMTLPRIWTGEKK